MEHDDRDDREYQEILESLANDQGAFEEYLSRKVVECASKTDVVSEMRELVSENTSGSEVANVKAADAVEASSNSEASPTGVVGFDSSAAANGVVNEQQVKLVLHNHPIIGSYTTEVSEPFIYDDEMKHIYFETINVAVSSMTAEQIIERRNRLNRDVQLIRMQQQGLHVALEDVLKARSWKEREQLMEMDRKYRVQANKKVKAKAEKSGSSSSIAKAASKGKTKAMKAVDTFKSMLMDAEGIRHKLTELKMMDEATEAYIKKVMA